MNQSGFTTLPHEVKIMIFRWMRPADLLRLGCTCKTMAALTDSDAAIWSEYLIRLGYNVFPPTLVAKSVTIKRVAGPKSLILLITRVGCMLCDDDTSTRHIQWNRLQRVCLKCIRLRKSKSPVVGKEFVKALAKWPIHVIHSRGTINAWCENPRARKRVLAQNSKLTESDSDAIKNEMIRFYEEVLTDDERRVFEKASTNNLSCHYALGEDVNELFYAFSEGQSWFYDAKPLRKK
ncbi:hypothetical protein BDR26DRAFT_854310 [Obelidium mucronatum]|nr:hypothetical protein BDR26DRAFT_854310 [Obelidium mucronatum]